jgi:hypothetical protein
VSLIRRQDGGQGGHAVGLRPHLDPPFGFGAPVTLGGRTRIGALYGTIDDRPQLAGGLSPSGREYPSFDLTQ